MEHPAETPNVLLFFLAPQDSYRSPLFSPKEIFCGPDTERRVVDGRIRSLKTPVGRYDVDDILALMPTAQEPELLLVKADASERNLPRNLQIFDCPKVLLVGDTHHMTAPLQKVISYAQSEPFDYIVFDHTRHHAHWFAKAGFKNLHWLPALDFGFMPRDLLEAPSRALTFVGQSGRWHPWRRSVLSEVRKAGLPLEVLQGTLSKTADYYADSQVTLNVSLNGDLNLRVFEALGAGGFLLTDRLPEASGLQGLFEPGKHLDVWSSTEELIEKIRYYLAHPAEVARIRREGRAEILRHHHPDIKRRELYDLVFRGAMNPRYDLGIKASATHSFGPPRVDPEHIPGLQGYEWIQEIHRSSRATTVYCGEYQKGQAFPSADLPRLTVLGHDAVTPVVPAPVAASENSAVSILLLSEATEGVQDLLARFTGTQVIAPSSEGARLAEWGYFATAPYAGGMGLFKMARPVAHLQKCWETGAHDTVRLLLPHVLSTTTSAEDCLVVAKYADLLKVSEIFISSLNRAVALDRNCQAALLQLARIAVIRREFSFAGLALEEAGRCGPLPAEAENARLKIGSSVADKLHSYYALTGRTPTQPSEAPMKILLVTNLFPPQELGGYGRMMWEFANGLKARGHELRILTGDAEYLAKTASADEVVMEKCVSRTLTLTGCWGAGRINQSSDRAKISAIESMNAEKVLREAFDFEPDLVLAGNIDLLGVTLLQTATYAGFPVLHCVANQGPGYAPADQPRSAAYWVAPCSDWNGRALSEAGFEPGAMSTVYPGARIDRFYRAFLPDTRTLRIAYASIVAPYKGTHVLVEALGRLHTLGCNFTAEIAGEALDQPYADRLREYCSRSGLAGKVSFTGFLDRSALASLFGRSNVLVFPSQFAEPFGISQVEAMAAGLVVVTSGTGGAAEVVRDRQDGLVFKADDAGALAAQLGMLATDRAAFKRLQSAGQRRAFAFSVETSVRQIEKMAASLIQAAKAPAADISNVINAEALFATSREDQPVPAMLP